MSLLPQANDTWGANTTATALALRQEVENRNMRAAISAMGTLTGGAVTYSGNGSSPLAKLRRDALDIRISVVSNGYVVGPLGSTEQFICIGVADVADRVTAMLAAHQMDMQK